MALVVIDIVGGIVNIVDPADLIVRHGDGAHLGNVAEALFPIAQLHAFHLDTATDRDAVDGRKLDDIIILRVHVSIVDAQEYP